jgi:hypothetical protein
MDQDLRRLAHRALHEACGRGNSPLSAFEWAVSRVRSQRPQVQEADIRRAFKEVQFASCRLGNATHKIGR